MKLFFKYIQFLIIPGLALVGNVAFSKTDSVKIGLELPYINSEGNLVVDIYYNVSETITDSVFVRCYKYNSSSDSTLVYRKEKWPVVFHEGTHSKTLNLGGNEHDTWYLPIFYDILKKTSTIPPGSYKTFLTVSNGTESNDAKATSDSNTSFSKTFSYQADSTISATSPMKKELDATLIPENKIGILGRLLNQPAVGQNTVSGSKAIERGGRRIERLFKSRGLSQRVEQRGNKSFINLYCEDWFVGRYELVASSSAADQIHKQQQQLTGNVSSLATDELGSYRSLFSQVRELNKNRKDDNELRGEIALTGAWSTGQPEYGAEDNNYYEFRGRVETEVYDIPVSIEGYYTTQDAHRTVKGSYARVHYDADKAKAELMKLIGGYRTQFNQTLAKGKGLDQIYGSYLSGLESQKGRLLGDINREAGVKGINTDNINGAELKARISAALSAKIKDTAELLNSTEVRLDSTGKARRVLARAKAIEDSANKIYDRAMKRYKDVQELEEKITKYRGMLEQYKNTTYFDSSLGYDKVKNLKNGDETTYKQLAKSATGLLPNGKAKQFITGLTNFDAGIFPKYVSKYTIAGQQLKGLDVGYDIGFAQIGLTFGKTEYAGRDGSLDKYSTYGARALFSPLKGQKVGIVYYGYSPAKSAISNDEFYKNADIALPSFREPVHIVSGTYEGIIARTLIIEGEVASSFRKGSGQDLQNGMDASRLAWHLNAEGQVPHTGVKLTGSYEHGGKDFQNSTLPITVAGADLYKVGGDGLFFHGLLGLGIEYNHMQQSSFYSMGGNDRWGFSIATHSKQYPSFSVSYKPFATFRSYTDTLTVAQRPLLGAVWSGKASYQIKKRGGISWHFNGLFNNSTSIMDTIHYSSKLIQLNVSYNTKNLMTMFSAGQSTMTGGANDTAYPAHIKTSFLTVAASYMFSKRASLNGGADIGVTYYGLSRFGLNAGTSYHMKKAPLTVRANGRFGAYKLEGYSGEIRADGSSVSIDDKPTDPLAWRNILSGSLDLIWQFKLKLKE